MENDILIEQFAVREAVHFQHFKQGFYKTA